MKEPLVSVVLPVYNGMPYLTEAVESVLCQTMTDFELILIDDCSTDNGSAFMESLSDPRVRFFHHTTNQGLIATLNHGLSIARGNYILRMDQDDWAFPGRFERQVAYMESFPSIVAAGCLYETIESEGRSRKPQFPDQPDEVAASLLFFNPICHPSAIIRTNAIRSFNIQYRPEYLHAEDYRLWWELSAIGQLGNVPEVLLKYRIHPTQITSLSKTVVAETTKLLMKDMFKGLGVKSYIEIGEFWFPFLLQQTNFSPSASLPYLQEILVANQNSQRLPVNPFQRKVLNLARNIVIEAPSGDDFVWKWWKQFPFQNELGLTLKQQLRLFTKSIF